MIECIFTEDQLQERLEYWKEKLRLQDWIISIKFASQEELTDSLSANVSYLLENKQARIKILKNEEFPDDAWFPHDMEWLLVHELLHLHIAPIEPKNNSKYYAIEQAIEGIVFGLMALERK